MKKLLIFCIALLFPSTGIYAQANCATAMPITSIPFSSGTQTTCGTGNDYGADTFVVNYGGGEDYVYSLNVTNAPVNLKFALGGAATWKVASVHSACPPLIANSIGSVTTTGNSGSGIISFPTNGTYYVIIDTWPSPNCGEFTLDITIAPPAPNCSTLTTPNNGATVSSVNPTMTWTAPTTGVAPTGYKIYRGTTNPPTSLLTTVNAPVTTYANSNLQFNTTYYWYVVPTNAGSDALGCNSTVWSFTTPPPPPPPANDDCDGAIALTVNPDLSCATVTSGTTVSATASNETAPSCGSSGTNDDVWYKFTATNTSHKISLTNITGSTTDMAMSIYSGNCGSLQQISCHDPESFVATGLTVGTQYYIRVWTWSSTVTTTASFNICVGTPPSPPVNDDCSGAINLTINPNTLCATSVYGTTTSATASNETAPSCGASGTDDDVWYKFTATNTEHVVKLLGTNYDMAMAVYSGTCGGLQQILCSDPNTMTVTGLTVGTVYYVRVWTYTSTSGAEGNFNICVSENVPPSPPVNDECSNAVSLTVGGTFAQNQVTGDTSGSTNSTSLTADCLYNATDIGGNVWYKIVVPASGNVTVETDVAPTSSMTDSVLTIFDSCTSTTSIACNDDDGNGNFSKTELTGLTPGSTIYASVARYSSSGGGDDGTFLISAYDSSLLGTSEVTTKEKSIKVYPNPFTDYVNVADFEKVKSISVLDMSGKLVKTFAKPDSKLNLSNLNSGMYLLILNMKDNSKQTIKVIKR